MFGFIFSLIKNGWNVDFVSTAKKSKEAEELKQIMSVGTFHADPNDLQSTNLLLNKLKSKPHVALFDTFSVEEKFRFIEPFPNIFKFLHIATIYIETFRNVCGC